MDGFLRHSTVAIRQIGPFNDITDGVTAETGMSITQVKIFLSKNGGAFATISTANIAVHDADGFYRKTLGVADTGSLGTLKIQVSEISTALPVWHNWVVVPQPVYDSLILGTDYLQGDVIQIEGLDATAQIGSLIGVDVDPVLSLIGAPTTTLVTAIAAVPTVAEIQVEMEENGASTLDSLLDRLTAARAGYLDNLSGHTAQTGDSYAKLTHSLYGLSMLEAYVDGVETSVAGVSSWVGAPVNASISADVADVRDKMSTGIEKNTSFPNMEILMVDSTDHRTGKTGLTITAYRSLNGGVFGALSGTVASVGSGIYKVDLTAGDTNGDVITYRFTGSGADDTFMTIKTST